ncbi:response regulator transcription factor [Frigidibacter sp. MR17.14]|uniref:response regulator transcription factor n=1 Tax=Frigidibacter sp. MR17.14 TaxID=3126509 RepID=UPI0030130C7D
MTPLVFERKFSVAIIDDHPIFRRGRAAVLRDEPDVGAIYEEDSADRAVELAAERTPDIMILDLVMPGGGGLSALSRIAGAHPEVRCVLLTVNDCPDTAIEALNGGARGYILKGVPAGELISALRSIMRGDTFVSPAFATRLLSAAQESRARRDPAAGSLTFREEQVLRELKSGRSNREIAEILSISEKTVKVHMSSIMQKLGAKNRVEALVVYQRTRGAPPGGHGTLRSH